MEAVLFIMGGLIYTWIEVLWRGWTHWSMFLLGGLGFVTMGLLNEYRFDWNKSLILQSMTSAIIITILEFFTGCIINLWFKWNVWDYSTLPYNLLGQICFQYFLLWIPLSFIGIIFDDWIRYGLYRLFSRVLPNMKRREKPHYNL